LSIEFLIVNVIDRLFTVYYILLIARIIFSWFQVNLRGIWKQMYDFVYILTEPYLALFRSILPIVSFGGMGLDLSPIIALIVLGFIRYLVFLIIDMIFSIF
jgi:YggT family protein